MYSMTIPALKFVIKACSSVDIKLKCSLNVEFENCNWFNLFRHLKA